LLEAIRVIEFAKWLQSTPLSLGIQTHLWITPLLQSIHIVMIAVVFWSALMIALRVLGRMRADEPFADVWQRFAPWMWAGLVVLAITGIVLTIGEPVREFSATSFWTKLALIVVGIVTLLSFRGVLAASRQTGEFSTTARAAAVATVVIWTFIIFLGRAIAYDTEVWSPAATVSASAARE
jgi:uncharacterized membrane protein SirB2